jgi:hypothetical protein
VDSVSGTGEAKKFLTPLVCDRSGASKRGKIAYRGSNLVSQLSYESIIGMTVPLNECSFVLYGGSARGHLGPAIVWHLVLHDPLVCVTGFSVACDA